MSGRRRVVWALIVAGLFVAAVALYFVRRAPRTPWDSILAKIGQSNPNDIKGILAKANYYYWLHNLPKSTPLYKRAEQLAMQAHDDRDALYAKIGAMRSGDAVPFPLRPLYGPHRHELVWVPLQRSTVIRMLKNPRYAGAYFFGRTRGRRRPDGGRPTSLKTVPRDQWHALIRDAHPGYITWEMYEANLQRLAENARAHPAHSKSPPREGPALLQGLALCGNCGRRMAIRYHWRGEELVPDYMCNDMTIEKLEKACMVIPGENVDAAVSKLLLEAVTPMALEVSLAVQQEMLARLEEIDRLRLKQVERARYEANLAQRRYMQVQPENRLVADTLEQEWNQKLRALAEAKLEYERQRADCLPATDPSADGQAHSNFLWLAKGCQQSRIMSISIFIRSIPTMRAISYVSVRVWTAGPGIDITGWQTIATGRGTRRIRATHQTSSSGSSFGR